MDITFVIHDLVLGFLSFEKLWTLTNICGVTCTSVQVYETTRRHIHQQYDLNTDRSEHLKSRQGRNMLEASKGPYTRRGSLFRSAVTRSFPERVGSRLSDNR